MIRAIIVDIDGTVANLHHRLGLLPNYDAFFSEMDKDAPIVPVIEMVRSLYGRWHSGGFAILMVSGRPENYREVTEKWLYENGVSWSELYMRPKNDYRKDVIVKREILQFIRKEGVYNPILAIDDRPGIVQMWRDEGLVCLANEWHGEQKKMVRIPTLTLMVGPTGAGKSTYIAENMPGVFVVSSDKIREELCGDFKDQTKNEEVFQAVHDMVKARLNNGLDVVVDATNLRDKDRKYFLALAPMCAKIYYIVINRNVEDKRLDGGWRNNLDFDLIAKARKYLQKQFEKYLGRR